MKLRIRKVHELDKKLKWFEDHGRGFMVCKVNDPIAALFIDLEPTTELTEIPAILISDPLYKDTDRSDALTLLEDFTGTFVRTFYDDDDINIKIN